MTFGLTNYVVVLREHVPVFVFTKYKQWLVENVGDNDWEWSGGHPEPIRVWFRKQEDLLAFKLVFGIHNV